MLRRMEWDRWDGDDFSERQKLWTRITPVAERSESQEFKAARQ